MGQGRSKTDERLPLRLVPQQAALSDTSSPSTAESARASLLLAERVWSELQPTWPTRQLPILVPIVDGQAQTAMPLRWVECVHNVWWTSRHWPRCDKNNYFSHPPELELQFVIFHHEPAAPAYRALVWTADDHLSVRDVEAVPEHIAATVLGVPPRLQSARRSGCFRAPPVETVHDTFMVSSHRGVVPSAWLEFRRLGGGSAQIIEVHFVLDRDRRAREAAALQKAYELTQ